jgi:signal transduction histidine kinase
MTLAAARSLARRLWAAAIVNHTSQTGVLGTVVVLLVAALTTHLGGSDARDVAVWALLVVNGAVLASRQVPASVIPAGPRVALLVVGAAAAAALIAVSGNGFTPTFGYFVAGQAGFRLRTDRAVLVAVLCSVLCGGVLLFDLGGGGIPWYVGAATGFAAPLGMVSRSRRAAVDAAIAAAASAERAARAEARETVLAERARIARDVHDVLAHTLASINLQLETADALMEHGDDEAARQATRRARGLVRDGLLEAQRAVRALREDMVPLVEALTAMTASAGHPDPPVVVGQRRELDTSTAQALVRVAQESLTNAHKHAPGAPVRMTLTYAPDMVGLVVVNGAPPRGHRPLADTGGGMGLVGMRERIALVGGTMTASPWADADDPGPNAADRAARRPSAGAPDGSPLPTDGPQPATAGSSRTGHVAGPGWRVCVTIPV